MKSDFERLLEVGVRISNCIHIGCAVSALESRVPKIFTSEIDKILGIPITIWKRTDKVQWLIDNNKLGFLVKCKVKFDSEILKGYTVSKWIYGETMKDIVDQCIAFARNLQREPKSSGYL